jgi:AcrR family transcriptional regulator
VTVYSKAKSDTILQAALTLFAENGFHSSPVSQVAALAKVGVGSIYRYFKDKDELIHAVFAMVDEELQEAIYKDHDYSFSDQQQFIQFMTSLMHYLVAHPQEFQFLDQYYSSPYGSKIKHAKFLSEDSAKPEELPFVNLYKESRKKTIKDLPLPLFLAMTFGPVVSLMRDELSGLVTLNDELIRQTAETSWNAIKI